MNKKLQVFVSSTYTDLIEERQAAVQAILDAGHIPAGMELFKAGNESQLKTIYKWIDESDVYMLILGGRYGSIEEESGLSYTELEYRYAISRNIPVFAVVLSELFLTQKINSLKLSDVMEQKAADKYQTFKDYVMSKIIRKVEDCKDIKIAIHTTLNEFMREYDLIGWVRNSNENDTIQLLKDYNQLLKEKDSLNSQIQKLQEQLNTKPKQKFGNYSFDELVTLLTNKAISYPARFNKDFPNDSDEEVYTNALNFFYYNYNKLTTGISNGKNDSDADIYMFYNVTPFYIGFDILERVGIPNSTAQRMQTTKLGASFYTMLEAKDIMNK